MHIKTARDDISRLLLQVDTEQRENIKMAAHNARCTDVARLMPYKNAAFCQLIRELGELVDLVENEGDL